MSRTRWDPVYGVLHATATRDTVTDKDGAIKTVPVTDGLWVVNNDTTAASLFAPGLGSPVVLLPAPGHH